MKEFIEPIKKEESEPSFDKFQGIWVEGFDNVSQLKAKSGRIVLGTDKGLRSENQDALILDIGNDAFAVIDGMGGEERGGEAAQIVAEEILRGIKEKTDPQTIQINAWGKMRKARIHEGGACYVAAQIVKKELKIWHAGDARLIVLDDKGEIKFSTKPTRLINSPTGLGPGKAEISSTNLMNYFRIIVASDGLFDNIRDEIFKDLKNIPIKEALKQLVESAKNMMERGIDIFDTNSIGNKDNLTILIYEILPVPLRGKY